MISKVSRKNPRFLREPEDLIFKSGGPRKILKNFAGHYLKEFWRKFRPPQQAEKPSSLELGILGEKLAREYLRRRGYHILETNFRCPLGEIDIVARHKDALAFIEVRTRSTRDFGTPEESVTRAKQRKLSKLAEFYLKSHPELSFLSPRIDVVAVEMEGRKVRRINLIQDALA